MNFTTSPHGRTPIRSYPEVTLPQTNFGPNHPFFYEQFSFDKTFQERSAALKNLKKMSSLQLATLHFKEGTCTAFHEAIVRGMDGVFSSEALEDKGLVFVHLIETINKIAHEITTRIYISIDDKLERMKLFSFLRETLDRFSLAGFFTHLDLRFNYLKDLDMMAVDLSYTSFNDAFVVNTDFRNATLTGATFKNADISMAKGIPKKNRAGAFKIESDYGSSEKPEKCIIS